MSRLVDQLRQAVEAFSGCRTPPALIGGLALAAHSVVRATQDVDFLVDADDAQFVHDVLEGLGYRCVHRSDDAANYVRGDQGLDLLFAHRPVARRLLAEADDRATALGHVHVISAEGLIAFKLQALTNDPSRRRDLEDIRALLRAQQHHLDMGEVREQLAEPLVGDAGVGFRPVARADLSDWIELMEVVEALCPVWPERRAAIGGEFKL